VLDALAQTSGDPPSRQLGLEGDPRFLLLSLIINKDVRSLAFDHESQLRAEAEKKVTDELPTRSEFEQLRADSELARQKLSPEK